MTVRSIYVTLIPLTHIVNKSLESGIVPDNMKVARVIPLFKSGDQHVFNNYRLISILPAFYKILEQIMSVKVMKYMDSQNILFQHHYGFRKGHSTIHPIIHLLNRISIANDKTWKDLTLSVFIDISKAFDTIWDLGEWPGHGLKIIFATVNSIWNYMGCNQIPKLSHIGPILFLIYINDIHKCTSLYVLSFADDTTIMSSSNDIKGI